MDMFKNSGVKFVIFVCECEYYLYKLFSLVINGEILFVCEISDFEVLR